jgi:putative ABC transport system permease protein
MLRHYLRLSWRLLLRSKLYSSINIIGLATGMAVAMLIGLWVWDELSFDQYHLHHERLASILSIWSVNGEVSVETNASVPLAAELRSKFPADFKDVALVAGGGHLLIAGEKKIQQWGMWAQPDFPAMMSLRLLKGNPAALRDPGSMLIAQWLATSLFGNADPINKSIVLDGQTVMKVGGVYEDLPQNSAFYGTTYLLAWGNKANRGTTLDADWYDHHFELYVQLADQSSFVKTAAKIKDITKPHVRGSYEEIGLHPMDRWRLYDEFRNGKAAGGRIRQVRLFTLIGCFVLLLACINFMNLSTARSGQRAKEVGLRKAIGSQRRQLIGQFLGESFLMTILAMVLSVGLMVLIFPLYNTLAGKQLSIPWGNPWFWLAVFISCLGLFGLASFTAEQRTREIGIRKVLGATVFQLWGLLSKESVLLVLLSFGIAVPVAWSYTHAWLQGYAYRAPISWWIFAIAGAGALVITLAVVSVQSIRAALLNPVKSLKME